MILLFLSILLILLFHLAHNRKPFNSYPPGPKGLPFLGHSHYWGHKPHVQLMQLAKKYGNIFSLKFGSFNVVILNNYKDIRDAFSKPAFDGRPCFKAGADKTKSHQLGIIFNHGKGWSEERRFAIKILRGFGFGSTSIESHISHEILELIENLKENIGKPMNIRSDKLNSSVFNITWKILAGKRYSFDDPLFQKLEKGLSTTAEKSRTALIRFFPLLYFLWRRMTPFLKKSKDKNDTTKSVMSFITTAIEDHWKTFQMEDEPRDFIDAYLNDIERNKDNRQEKLKNLKITVRDLFIAAMDTTSTTLSWSFLLLAIHQDKQIKLRNEINRVVGLSRHPTLSDRSKMPYTEAVIHEVQRYVSLTPFAMFHSTLEDTNFRGFDIPKGTMICSNMFAAMHDTDIWGDPDVFRPERFLSTDGKSLMNNDAYMPFGVGRRMCLGVNLAQNELFLFTAFLFQRFKMGTVPDADDLSLESQGSRMLMPLPQNILLQNGVDD